MGKEGRVVVSANGKPFALMLSITEDSLDGTLSTLRRAAALQAVDALQRRSVETGVSKMKLKEINRAIKAARSGRRRRSRG